MDDKYISLIAKYMSGDIMGDEREALFELVNGSEAHKAYFEEMQSLWDLSSIESEEVEVDTDFAWQKVAQRIETPVEVEIVQKTAKIFKFGQLLKIAAVFIGVLGAAWFFYNSGEKPVQFAEYQTLGKERQEVTLPDGSQIWLNENSKLRYNKDFEPRIVELEGEAFFEVKHLDSNHKFEIKSGDTKTTVLGTSFNVRAYPEETQVEVTVETGKVLFEDDKGKEEEKKVFLIAGQSGVYKKKEEEIIRKEETISNADAWKTQKLVFNNVKFSEVIEVVKRYFNVDIQVENPKVLNCTYKGTFTNNPKIKDLTDNFNFMLNLEINQKENSLILSGGDGCE